MKNVRNTQPCISMNFFSKAQVLACEYRLVLDLPTSILVRASVSLLTFHTSTILAPLWFTNLATAEQIPEPFHFHAVEHRMKLLDNIEGSQ